MPRLFPREIIGARTPGDAPDWCGRYAALIQSKERKAKKTNSPTDYDKVHDEDIVQKKKKVKSVGQNTAECMDIDSVEIFLGRMNYIPDVRPSLKQEAEKALQYGHWSKAVAKDRSSTELVLIAKVVGGLLDSVKPYMEWILVEKYLPNEMFHKLKNDVFGSIAKFSLSIFDVEDFAKHPVSKDREDNYRSLLYKLKCSQKANSFEELCELEWKCSMNALRSIANGIDVSFKGLTELDIYCLLRNLVVEPVDEKWYQAGLVNQLRLSKLGESELTLKQMETYIPLKGNCKMQLFLELLNRRCYHTLDYLFVEACQGFVSEELFNTVDEKRKGLGITVVSNLVAMVHNAILNLAGLKLGLLEDSLYIATYSLRFFGEFADEVIEVVQIADHERRAHGHPFVGVYHILFGLTFSRVGQQPLVQSGFMNSSAEKLPEAPPYKIFMLAGEKAKACGVQMVSLEHLVLAVIDVQEEKTCVSPDSEKLKNFKGGNHEFKTEVLKEVGLSHDSKPIEGYENLAQALRDGIKIPEIRQQD